MTDNALAEITEPDAIKTALETSVKALAIAQQNEALANVEKTAAKSRLTATTEWVSLQIANDTLKARKREEREHYDAVRIIATDLFLELGEKKIVEGIQVIEKNVFKVLDDEAAIKWCEEFLPLAITISFDKDFLETNIRKMSEDKRPDFVLIETKAAIRVSDLSAWLDADSDGDKEDDVGF